MLSILLTIENEADRDFVEEIYRTYGKKIYYIAFRIVKNKEEAEDCLQDVMKKIIDDLPLFRKTNTEQLISLIVIRTQSTAIDHYRKEARKREHEYPLPVRYDYEDDEIEITDEDAFTEALIINEENKKRLTALIGELKPIYRDVLWLRYMFQMTREEIARFLDISENTVKLRLWRAKKILLQTREDELYDIRKE